MRKLMNRLSTIRIRLTLWYVFFLAVTILAFATYLYLQLQLSLNTQLDDGLQVAASQLLVKIDDTSDPPTFRTISDSVVERLDQSRFAVRLISGSGNVTDEVGNFPKLS